MSSKNQRFGRFIRQKRISDPRELTLTGMAKTLDMSVSMLSDIEQCRRKPYDNEKIATFCEYMHLTPDEKALMYDLAARDRGILPNDIGDYMMNSEIGNMARMALRMSKEGIIKEESWKKLIREARESEA